MFKNESGTPFTSEVSSLPVIERTFSLFKLTFGKPSAALRLQIPSLDDALALYLSFGQTNTRFGDFPPADSHPDV
jgi:hypothetical protein